MLTRMCSLQNAKARQRTSSPSKMLYFSIADVQQGMQSISSLSYSNLLHTISLDQIEGRETPSSLPKHIQRKHPKIPAKATIYFRGVLTVQSLKQLTERGKAAINTEAARRHHECCFPGDPWSIKIFFDPNSGRAKEQFAVKILIQGEKNMPAIYMAGNPNIMLHILSNDVDIDFRR